MERISFETAALFILDKAILTLIWNITQGTGSIRNAGKPPLF